jgi:putative two-component system response regulator
LEVKVADKKPEILVIDDQVIVIRVMERMLNEYYRVISARSGEEGLSMARDNLPDLILLDMVMPGMSGIEVCQKLRADALTSKIPIIFVSAMDDRHNEESGFRAGAVDYISKPPSPAIVNARIKVHLENTRQVKFIEAIANGYLSDAEEIRAAAKDLLDIN